MKKHKMTTKKKNTGSRIKKKRAKKVVLQEVSVIAKDLKISPRKLRLIAKEISPLSPLEAEKRLVVASQKGAAVFLKILRNAFANAVNNSGLEKETLVFKEIVVNEASALVRRDRFHGARFNGGLIKKRRSHLLITVIGKRKE